MDWDKIDLRSDDVPDLQQTCTQIRKKWAKAATDHGANETGLAHATNALYNVVFQGDRPEGIRKAWKPGQRAITALAEDLATAEIPLGDRGNQGVINSTVRGASKAVEAAQDKDSNGNWLSWLSIW